MRPFLQHLNEIEGPICRAWSRPRRNKWFLPTFAAISRLGDGVFWYGLTIVLPLVNGFRGLQAAAHMLLVGAVALALYKNLKSTTRRARPCHAVSGMTPAIAPLDLYSFPSGHTLHAVSFTAVAVDYYPGLAWVLVPFTALVACSRVVLGLHYPSDVLVATAIGSVLAYGSILLLS